MSSPSDVIDTTSSVRLERRAGLGRRRRGAGTRPGRPPRRRARRGRRASAADSVAPSPLSERLDLVGRRRRQRGRSRSIFHTVIESRSTTSAPPSTAWTVVLASTCRPAGLAIRSMLSSTTVTVPRVRSWTTMTSRRLVDVVVGAGIGHADGGRHLADEAVDVTDVPLVALEQPGAAVVGVGLRALAALGLQGGDDDGADDEPEHDEHAAGDAAPGAPASSAAPARAASVVHCCSTMVRRPSRSGGSARRPRHATEHGLVSVRRRAPDSA